MVDDDTPRPSLEAPRLFGRRRATRPDVDEPVFEDAGTDPAAETAVVPVVEPGEPEEPDETDETAVLPVETPVRRPGARRGRRTSPAAAADPTGRPSGGLDVDDASPSRTRRATRDRSTPLLPGRPAAALTGVLAGLALLGFTWLGFRGCEAVSGTTSCGVGPGMAALVVVMVLTIVVGGLVLAFFQIPEPGSTSFLGTGLTGVIYLVALVDRLEGWPALVVIPAISAGTYTLSWWVTTTYVADE